jgi:hypothetical protein
MVPTVISLLRLGSCSERSHHSTFLLMACRTLWGRVTFHPLFCYIASSPGCCCIQSTSIHSNVFFLRTVANSSKSTYLQHSSLLLHDEDTIDCFFHLAMVLEWSAASQHHDLVFHFLKCNKKTQNTGSFTFSVLSFEQIIRYPSSTPTVGGADQVSGE